MLSGEIALKNNHYYYYFTTAAQFLQLASSVNPLEDLLIPLSKYSHTNVLLPFSDIVEKKLQNLSKITALSAELKCAKQQLRS